MIESVTLCGSRVGFSISKRRTLKPALPMSPSDGSGRMFTGPNLSARAENAKTRTSSAGERLAPRSTASSLFLDTHTFRQAHARLVDRRKQVIDDLLRRDSVHASAIAEDEAMIEHGVRDAADVVEADRRPSGEESLRSSRLRERDRRARRRSEAHVFRNVLGVLG